MSSAITMAEDLLPETPTPWGRCRCKWNSFMCMQMQHVQVAGGRFRRRCNRCRLPTCMTALELQPRELSAVTLATEGRVLLHLE